MDATRVNVHGQIVHWGEFHPSFPLFLGQLVLLVYFYYVCY